MSGKIESAISAENISLATQPENNDFFKPVKEVKLEGDVKLGIKVDPETRVKTEALPNGDIEVTYTYPIDNNTNPIDGRIYLKDTFVFEKETGEQKGFNRDFSYNGSGENKEQWRKWLSAYQAIARPDDEKIADFARKVASSYARPLTPNMLKDIYDKQGPFRPFVASASQVTQSEGLRVHPKSELSHFSVVNQMIGGVPTQEVTFSYALGNSQEEPLSVQDVFTVDVSTKQVLGYRRNWVVNPSASNKGYWKEVAKKFDAAEQPKLEDAKKIWVGFAPEVAKPIDQIISELQAEPTPPSPEFFNALGKQSNYFNKLNEALAPDLTLSFNHSRVTPEVKIEGGKTTINFHYEIPSTQDSKIHLEYIETFEFEGQALKQIHRRTKVVDDSDQTLKAVEDRIAKAFSEMPMPSSDEAKQFVADVIPLVASHLDKNRAANFYASLEEQAHESQSVDLAQIEDNFFAAFAQQGEYFDALNQTLGSDLALRLKNPQVSFKVEVEGERTVVELNYKLLPEQGASDHHLEYTEKFVFDGQILKNVDRNAKVIGGASAPLTEAEARIREAVEQKKFPDVNSKEMKNFLAQMMPFVAPHIGKYGEGKRLKELEPQQNMPKGDQVALDIAFAKIQAELLPHLYSKKFDPKISGPLVRLLMAFQYSDSATVQDSFQEIQQYSMAQQAQRTRQGVSGSRSKEEILASVITSMAVREIESAVSLAKQLPRDLYESISPSLEELQRKIQLQDKLEMIAVVFEEQLEKRRKASTAWFSSDHVDADGEKKLLRSVLEMAKKEMGKTDAKSPLEFLANLPDLNYPDKEAEKKFVEKLRSDRILNAVDLTLRETNRELQSQAYFHLSEHVLFKNELVSSAHYLMHEVLSDKLPKSRSRESVDILEHLATESLQTQGDQALQDAVLQDAKERQQDITKKSAFEETVKKNLENNDDYKTLTAEQKNLQDLLVEAEKSLTQNPDQNLLQSLQSLQNLPPELETLRNGLISSGEEGQLVRQLGSLFHKSPDERENFYQTEIWQYVQTVKSSEGNNEEAAKLYQELYQAFNQKRKKTEHPTQEAMIFLSFRRNEPIQNLINLLQYQIFQKTAIEAVQDKVLAEQQPKQQAMQDLILIARERSLSSPRKTAFEIIHEIEEKSVDRYYGLDGEPAAAGDEVAELSFEARKARKTALLDAKKTILADKTFERFSQASMFEDPNQRREAYLALGEEFLQVNPETQQVEPKEGFKSVQTISWLTEMVKNGQIPDASAPIPPRINPERGPTDEEQMVLDQISRIENAQDFYNLTEGKGSLGIRVQYGAPHFLKETTKPSMLAAMTLGTLAGGATELMIARKIGGYLGMALGFVGGVGVESIAFTTSSKVFDSAFVASEGQWGKYGEAYGRDLGVNAVTFGVIKGGHAVVGKAAEKLLATGKLGKWAGGYVSAETAGVYRRTAFGELYPKPLVGGAVPQLTRSGQALTSVLEHTVAVGGMWGSGYINRWIGLQRDNGKDKWGNLNDALIMYAQAGIGAGIANKLTSGYINTINGELRRGINEAHQKTHGFGKNVDVKGPVFDLVNLKDLKSDSSPILLELAAMERPDQMTLANAVERAKSLNGARAQLQYHPIDALKEAVNDVESGKKSADSLPIELGLQRNFKRLMEQQIEAWKKMGFDPDQYAAAEVEGGEPLTPLDKAFQAGQAWAAHSAAGSAVSSVEGIMAWVAMSPLQKMGGMGKVEVLIRLAAVEADLALSKETAREQQANEQVDQAQKAFDEATEAGKPAEDIASLQRVLDEANQAKEDAQKAVAKAQGKFNQAQAVFLDSSAHAPTAKELIESLPAGVRQKARDIYEETNSKQAGQPSDPKFVHFVISGLNPILPKDPALAARELRQNLDAMTPQARRLFLSARSDTMRTALIDAYLGPDGRRELPTLEVAAEISQLLQAAKVPGDYRVVVKYEGGGQVVELHKNHGEALPDNGVVGIRFTKQTTGAEVHFTTEEIESAEAQAKKLFEINKGKQPSGTFPYHADSSAPTFSVWKWGSIGRARLTIKLDPTTGGISSKQVQYTVNPKAGAKAVDQAMAKAEEVANNGVEVEAKPFKELSADAPFTVRAPSWWDRSIAALPNTPQMPDKISRVFNIPRNLLAQHAQKLAGRADPAYLQGIHQATTRGVTQRAQDAFDARDPNSKDTISVMVRVNLDTGQVLPEGTMARRDYLLKVNVDPVTGKIEIPQRDRAILQAQQNMDTNHGRKQSMQAMIDLNGKKVEGGTEAKDGDEVIEVTDDMLEPDGPSSPSPEPADPANGNAAGAEPTRTNALSRWIDRIRGKGNQPAAKPDGTSVQSKPADPKIQPADAAKPAEPAAADVDLTKGLAKGIETVGKPDSPHPIKRAVEALRDGLQTVVDFFKPKSEPYDPKADRINGVDPRIEKADVSIKADITLRSSKKNSPVGESHVVAGGAEGEFTHKFPDGSKVSVKTEKGARKENQDGYLVAWYQLPDGTLVKVLTVADGAGGVAGGALAGSSYLNGIHARVAEAAARGEVVNAKVLHEAGVEAVVTQKRLYGIPDATGGAKVTVIVGDEASIASVADVMETYSVKGATGYQVVGYTNVDHLSFRSGMAGIRKGIAPDPKTPNNHIPNVYKVSAIPPGARLIGGSDGSWEGILDGYKSSGSAEQRSLDAVLGKKPNNPPTQSMFQNVNRFNDGTANNPKAGIYLHDATMQAAPEEKTVSAAGVDLNLAQVLNGDNGTTMLYEQGPKVSPAQTKIPHPEEAKSLEPVGPDNGTPSPPTGRKTPTTLRPPPDGTTGGTSGPGAAPLPASGSQPRPRNPRGTAPTGTASAPARSSAKPPLPAPTAGSHPVSKVIIPDGPDTLVAPVDPPPVERTERNGVRKRF